MTPPPGLPVWRSTNWPGNERWALWPSFAEPEAGPTPAKAHFYYPVKHRYSRRQIREIVGLIAEFQIKFTRAVGHHGENIRSGPVEHDRGQRNRARLELARDQATLQPRERSKCLSGKFILGCIAS